MMLSALAGRASQLKAAVAVFFCAPVSNAMRGSVILRRTRPH
jgi:hypothetical protein